MPGSQSPLQVISSNFRDQTNLIAVANGKEGHGQNYTLAVVRHDKASLGGQLWGQTIRANDNSHRSSTGSRFHLKLMPLSKQKPAMRGGTMERRASGKVYSKSFICTENL